MNIVYSQEELPKTITKSLFLLGPTPRSSDVRSWRQDALKLLSELNYDGTVFVPEDRSWLENEAVSICLCGHPRDDHEFAGFGACQAMLNSFDKEGIQRGCYYCRAFKSSIQKERLLDVEKQIEWEELCLNVADKIVAWLPCELKTMPGFASRVEWGRWESSGKLILGFPENAEKLGYISYYAKKEEVPTFSSLKETISKAVSLLGKGAKREGGDRYVPLQIWETPQFQSWHKAQVQVGNYLEDAKVLYSYFHRPKEHGVFLFILRTHVFIKNEGRVKKLDFTLSRSDISSVLLYKKGASPQESEVVFVREFRPSVSNKIAYVVELVSGSNSDPEKNDPWELAVEEVSEETGFSLDPKRLVFHGARQLVSTLSAHKSHLFSVEITQEELDWFKGQKNIAHGNLHDGERTFIEVLSYKDLFTSDTLDWTALGQVLSVLHG